MLQPGFVTLFFLKKIQICIIVFLIYECGTKKSCNMSNYRSSCHLLLNNSGIFLSSSLTQAYGLHRVSTVTQSVTCHASTHDTSHKRIIYHMSRDHTNHDMSHNDTIQNTSCNNHTEAITLTTKNAF